jgi:hypothetical protein
MLNLPEFVRESNMIEGIHREPTEAEIDCLKDFIDLPVVRTLDLCAFVQINQPDANIRNKLGMDVRVGGHQTPNGGKRIVDMLQKLLDNIEDLTPYEMHSLYEQLHPFTDGNGRSGRALWAWQMWEIGLSMHRGFLHTFYYQTLNDARERIENEAS